MNRWGSSVRRSAQTVFPSTISSVATVVDVSRPYFIPFPLPPVGTFGAVIVMRGRIRSRNALMEVGAAGPIAGMVVAIPILLVGLSLSPVAPPPEGGLMEGQSLLYLLLKYIADM